LGKIHRPAQQHPAPFFTHFGLGRLWVKFMAFNKPITPPFQRYIENFPTKQLYPFAPWAILGKNPPSSPAAPIPSFYPFALWAVLGIMNSAQGHPHFNAEWWTRYKPTFCKSISLR
jgi:hypothetical protein